MYKICKNKSSKQRQFNIMKSLLELLQDKHINSITITQLCIYANIPRKTFYRYFESIDDVFDYWADYITNEIIEYIGIKDFTIDNLKDVFLSFYEYWGEHKEYIKIIRNNQLSQAIFSRMVDNEAIMNLKSDKIQEDELQIRIRFLLPSLISIVYLWDDKNYSFTPKELANMTYKSLTTPII